MDTDLALGHLCHLRSYRYQLGCQLSCQHAVGTTLHAAALSPHLWSAGPGKHLIEFKSTQLANKGARRESTESREAHWKVSAHSQSHTASFHRLEKCFWSSWPFSTVL